MIYIVRGTFYTCPLRDVVVADTLIRWLAKHINHTLGTLYSFIIVEISLKCMNSKNSEMLFLLDQDTYYTGRVFGEKLSDVKLHMEDGIITGIIHTADETYHIEVNNCLCEPNSQYKDKKNN